MSRKKAGRNTKNGIHILIFTLLTFCPPAPELLIKDISKDSSGIEIRLGTFQPPLSSFDVPPADAKSLVERAVDCLEEVLADGSKVGRLHPSMLPEGP
jgi:hypothetical protein